MVLLAPHFDKAVMGHRLQRAGQVAGLPAGLFRKRRDRFGLGFLDHLEQRPVFVAQYLGKRPHGGEPDFWVARLGLEFSPRDGQQAFANLVLRHDADHNGFHRFLTSSSTRSTS